MFFFNVVGKVTFLAALQVPTTQGRRSQPSCSNAGPSGSFFLVLGRASQRSGSLPPGFESTGFLHELGCLEGFGEFSYVFLRE